jgi:hypothetical protein
MNEWKKKKINHRILHNILHIRRIYMDGYMVMARLIQSIYHVLCI